MCIIIHKPQETEIDRKLFDQFWQHNADGFGLAVFGNEKIEVQKTLKLKTAWKMFDPYQDQECVLHFRIGTSGGHGIDYCHPHWIVKDRCCLFHNGHLSDFDWQGSGLSDSQTLARGLGVFKSVHSERIEFLSMLKYQKFLIMTIEQEAYKLTRIGDWQEYQGLFVSNLSFTVRRSALFKYDSDPWYRDLKDRAYNDHRCDPFYYSDRYDPYSDPL